ncbi:hypothetical protein NG726_19475 [Pseudomonas sp. MOB-449]|nr:hypothetical protein [Pseudomonas sp. MOB-449]
MGVFLGSLAGAGHSRAAFSQESGVLATAVSAVIYFAMPGKRLQAFFHIGSCKLHGSLDGNRASVPLLVPTRLSHVPDCQGIARIVESGTTTARNEGQTT